MTHHTTSLHTFRCDSEGCWNLLKFKRGSRRGAKRRARLAGWSVHSGCEFCPECNTKPLPECPSCGAWELTPWYPPEVECDDCGEVFEYDGD